MAAHNDREERRRPPPLDGTSRPAHSAGRRSGSTRGSREPRPEWDKAQAKRVKVEMKRVQKELRRLRAAEIKARRKAKLPV